MTWGIYDSSDEEEELPTIRYDPFYCLVDNGTKISQASQISPTRFNKPYEMQNRLDDSFVDSFCRIIEGELPAIIVAVDDQAYGNPLSEKSERKKWNKHDAISFINMFSPMVRINHAVNTKTFTKGVALVHAVVEHYDLIYEVPIKTLESLLINTQVAQKETIRELKKELNEEKLRLMHFYNIGIESGASIPHLHSQTYVYSSRIGKGIISNFHKQAVKQNKTKGICVGCELATKQNETNIFSQELKIQQRTIFENDNWRILTAFAPIREGHLRLISKKHVSNFIHLNQEQLIDLAEALHIADHSLNAFIEGSNLSFLSRINRNILFKQGEIEDSTTHLFIEFFINHPIGGAELLDSFRISKISPEKVAEIIRKGLKEKKLC